MVARLCPTISIKVNELRSDITIPSSFLREIPLKNGLFVLYHLPGPNKCAGRSRSASNLREAAARVPHLAKQRAGTAPRFRVGQKT